MTGGAGGAAPAGGAAGDGATGGAAGDGAAGGRGARPAHMRAAVLRGPGRLDVADVPVPEVGDDGVLAVDLCGVCGSDLHMVVEGWGEPGSWQGHGWVGRVAAVGPGVTRWAAADPVVGGPPVACGACSPCRAGRPSLCAGRDAPGVGSERGAFATYKVVRAGELLALPAGLDPRAAALTEPLAVALHGSRGRGRGPASERWCSGRGRSGR